MGIGEAFEKFCNGLLLTNGSTISYRYNRITNQLNRDFYGYPHDTWHSLYTGSYGRETAIVGFSDLDVLFLDSDPGLAIFSVLKVDHFRNRATFSLSPRAP